MARARELGHDLIPLEEVRQAILSRIRTIESEDAALEDSWHRVLREDPVSADAVPPFDNSAMDGYAVRSEDLREASGERPVSLAVAGRIQAGDAGGPPIGRGQAARIMTGAPLPPGADAVVPHEFTRFTEEQATFLGPAHPGANIRRAGSDMQPGDRPISAGTRLRGPQMAVLAALGWPRLRVSRRPRVAVLSPGKELIWPGDPAASGQIRNSNAFGLAGLLRDAGALPEIGPIVEDSPQAIRAAIRKTLEGGADAIITTGGVSAGDFDFVQAVVREDGDPGFAFKTAMRPGKPQVFGLLGGKPVFGLPGNPASALISYMVFVLPALRLLMDEKPVVPPMFPVRFQSDFPYRGGRVFVLRARVEPDFEHAAGGFRVGAIGSQDSSLLASLAAANALVYLPAERESARAGEVFPAQWMPPA